MKTGPIITVATAVETEPCRGGIAEPCPNRIPAGTTPRLCPEHVFLAHLLAGAMRVPSLP